VPLARKGSKPYTIVFYPSIISAKILVILSKRVLTVSTRYAWFETKLLSRTSSHSLISFRIMFNRIFSNSLLVVSYRIRGQ